MKYRDDDDGMQITSREGGMAAFRRFLVTLLLLVLIAWGTLFFLLRTDGGQAFIRDQLEKQLRSKVTFVKARLVPPLSLVLEQVVSEGWDTVGAPGFRAEELRVLPGWPVRVRVRGGECRLVRDAEERWQPVILERLGDVPVKTVAALSTLTAASRHGRSWSITDSAVTWLDAEGRRMASASNIDFEMVPVRLPGRRAWYYRLGVYEGQAPDGSRFGETEAEWLSTESRAYIELSRREGRMAAGALAFWNPSGDDEIPEVVETEPKGE